MAARQGGGRGWRGRSTAKQGRWRHGTTTREAVLLFLKNDHAARRAAAQQRRRLQKEWPILLWSYVNSRASAWFVGSSSSY